MDGAGGGQEEETERWWKRGSRVSYDEKVV